MSLLINNETLQNIADAIRYKNGLSTTYLPSEMDDAILALSTGDFDIPLYFVATENNTVIYLNSYESLNINLQISSDGQNWSNWNSSVNNGTVSFAPITLSNNERLYIRGNNQTFASDIVTYSSFVIQSGYATVNGNIMSLLSHNFSNLTSLSSRDFCFYSLFRNCTKLTSAKNLVLPATTLSQWCYGSMFYGCSNLTEFSSLPSLNLSDNCYSSMFASCTSLVTPPELPATTLASSCYSNMFSGCTNLTSTPKLPATTLATRCYNSMFMMCSNLVNAPIKLPATTLENYCYASMFSNCTSLKIAPILPATTLVQSCYTSMFYGCTSLKYIEVYAESWNTSYTTNWVSNISSTGVFNNKKNISIPSGNNGIPTNWTIVDNSHLCFIPVQNNSSISLYRSISNLNFEISYDAVTWNTWNLYSSKLFEKIILNPGEILYIRGNNTTLNSANPDAYFSSYTQFKMSGKFYSSGDMSSLLNYSKKLTTGYALTYLFRNCISLITPPEFPIVTLSSYCCRSMFSGCTSLIQAPELPATILTTYCYDSMFSGCTSLIQAPELPATILATYCYQQMFYGCTSLVTPPELPATTLSNYCYHSMFYGCTSLTSAPILPATTLGTYCYYQMFRECTSLKIAPILPATTLTNYCYASMFYGCTSLIQCADIQNATTVGTSSCGQMYRHCSKLNNLITPNISSWSTSVFSNWADDIAASGTLYKPSSLTVTEGVSGIPSGWISKNHKRKITLSSKGTNNVGFTYYINSSSYTLNDNSEIEIELEESDVFKISKSNSVISINGRRNKIIISEYTFPYYEIYGKVTCELLQDIPDLLCFTANTAGSTVGLTIEGSTPSLVSPSLYISTNNKVTWTVWDYSTKTLANVNDKIYIIGINNKISDSTNAYSKFNMTGSISASGSLKSILSNLNNQYSLYKLFDACSSLTSAPELPYTSLQNYCYDSMFSGCSSLTSAPILPANSFGFCSYNSMFSNCSSLNSIQTNAVVWQPAYALGWVQNVAASGTFTKLTNTTIQSGNNGIPSGWTVQNI